VKRCEFRTVDAMLCEPFIALFVAQFVALFLALLTADTP
jgi:hypothetical protein